MPNAARVREVFLDCLFKPGEDTTHHVPVHGLTMNLGFHPERLQSYEAEIGEMLADLPDTFQANGGGGMSFLNGCVDKSGELWTGLQETVQQLFVLGIGVDKAKFLSPREEWNILPGGVPYIVVNY